MAFGEIAARAVTSGEFELTKFAFIAASERPSCSRTEDFNPQPKLVLIY